MKRYEFDIEKDLEGDYPIKVESKHGRFVEFTDHQAEIAKLLELLTRCGHFMQQKTLKSEFDVKLYHDLMNYLKIAQKDSTQ